MKSVKPQTFAGPAVGLGIEMAAIGSWHGEGLTGEPFLAQSVGFSCLPNSPWVSFYSQGVVGPVYGLFRGNNLLTLGSNLLITRDPRRDFPEAILRSDPYGWAMLLRRPVISDNQLVENGKLIIGGMSRAAKGADCKSAGFAFVGSSPTSPTSLRCAAVETARHSPQGDAGRRSRARLRLASPSGGKGS